MPVGEFGGGALVLRAVGDLLEGDVITAVDGTPTYTVPDLVFRLASVKETCSLSVARHNEELLTLQLNRVEEGLWGLRVVTYRPRTELPVDLSAEIEPDWVGPSLGLMLGLSFLDALVGFAGGLSVAGTGILKSDGSLEAVGGVEYKARAARDLSIPVLLMPTSQSLDDQAAVKSIYNGSLFFVNTLSEAVETLEGLATS
jgi:PDZ domain-containing protein